MAVGSAWSHKVAPELELLWFIDFWPYVVQLTKRKLQLLEPSFKFPTVLGAAYSTGLNLPEVYAAVEHPSRSLC